MTDQSSPATRPNGMENFSVRHGNAPSGEDGERHLSEKGESQAQERAQSEEFSKMIDRSPANAVIFLGGASDAIRTRETGEAIGNALADVYRDRPGIHVIPPDEIRTFATAMGVESMSTVSNLFGSGARAIRETVSQIRSVVRDHPDQKVVVSYPLALKELSPNAAVLGVAEKGRWRLDGQETHLTDYTKYLLAKGKENPPDGDLREWFRNKGVVDGTKVGPSPEEVAEAYLKAFTRLKAFVERQVPERPVVVGLVGHSWDLDALAVYLGNGGVIDEAGYDRIRGGDRMIKETELLSFSVDQDQTTLDYRGRTVLVPAELAAERDGWDVEAVAELAERGIDVEAAFKIPEEHDRTGERIDADIYWVRYPRPAPTDRDPFEDVLPVEGKLYLPRGNPNGEIVQFGPGYPGGVAGRFEQHYARTFVDAGYAFATIRHNGTSLTETPKTQEIMNCPERFERAQATGERFIGGERPDGYRMRDLVYEPLVLLATLGHQFRRVHLMGQSFGATSIWASVSRLVKARPEFVNQLGNLVTIAGWLGGEYDEAADRLGGMKESIELTINRNLEYAAQTGMNVDTTSPTHREQMRADMREMAELLMQVTIPDTLNQVVIQSTEDPLITLEALTEGSSKTTYPGQSARSIIIHDESGRDPVTGQWLDKQHSHLWIQPENLLRAVRVKLSGNGPREWTVRSPLPKSERTNEQ